MDIFLEASRAEARLRRQVRAAPTWKLALGELMEPSLEGAESEAWSRDRAFHAGGEVAEVTFEVAVSTTPQG